MLESIAFKNYQGPSGEQTLEEMTLDVSLNTEQTTEAQTCTK